MRTLKNRRKRSIRFQWSIVVLVVILVAVVGVVVQRREKHPEVPPGPHRPAFPTAYGFGADARGGRGGAVIEVTNLKPDGPGSLRAAVVDATGPRTVVFRVGGIIDLGRRQFIVSHPFLTIAGQTAPGDGITVKGGYFNIQTHDVVIRYMRFRPGPGGWPSERASGGGGDGFAMVALKPDTVKRVILDHVSLSWGTDETFSVGGPVTDVTLQNSIVSEAMDCVPPPFEWSKDNLCSSKNMLLQSLKTGAPDRFTFHHDLLTDAFDRNPVFHSGDVDWVNNVVHNWGIPLVASPDGGTIRVNIIANYYRAGVNRQPKRIYSDGEFLLASDCLHEHTRCQFADTSGAYIPELVRPGDPLRNVATDTADGPLRTARTLCRPENQCFAEVPARFDFPPVPTTPAEVAYQDVLDRSGATLPRRDPVDARVIDQARQGTGKVINSPDDVGGYPQLVDTATTTVDTDHDGMPDSWESSHGLDPESRLDRNGDYNNNGYTNLEKYLDELAGDPPPAPAAPVFPGAGDRTTRDVVPVGLLVATVAAGSRRRRARAIWPQGQRRPGAPHCRDPRPLERYSSRMRHARVT